MASNSSPGNKFKRPTNVEVLDSSDFPDDSYSTGDSTSGKRMKKEKVVNVSESEESNDSSDSIDKTDSKNLLTKVSKQEGDLNNVQNLCNKEQYNSTEGTLNLQPTMSLASIECSEARSNTENSEARSNSENTGPVDRYTSELSRMSVQSDLSDNDSDDIEADDEVENVKPKREKLENYDPTPKTPKPKHTWAAYKEISSRQYGMSSKYSADLFRYSCYGSLHMVQRLELMYKMKKHDGCVNALNFNQAGTRLVSGSDDLHVILWDWVFSWPLLDYRSGHSSNVFQAKFMPLTNDALIVTCARDGQVRLGELTPGGGPLTNTRKLAQHKGSAHKLSVQHDSPYYLLSCGEDSTVIEIDLRQEKPNRLIVCKTREKKVPLYSIFINPQKSFEFAVCGRSQYVKVYDTRYLGSTDAVLKDYCPEHLESDNKLNITALVYNYNGEEILATYNDDDIYSFDAKETETDKYLHRYRGHRNNQTVKGVNYFGSKSEYIMSGSDCGYVFFWEKETEHIVKFMYGDEGGAVNCLEASPTMPVLATSGLDDDIKIWVPSSEDPPDLSNLSKHLTHNMKQREDELNTDYPDGFADHTIWFLMQHLARTNRRLTGGENSDSSISSSDDTDDSGVAGPQCNQQ